jgi:hypothetical protein
MTRGNKPEPPTMRDLAAEILRRSRVDELDQIEPEACYVFVSEPPTAQERLAIMAASLRGSDVAVFRRREMTEAEWVAHYCAGVAAN